MELTRLSKFFLESYQSILHNKVLDYGSRHGEIAHTLGCGFADHRLANDTTVLDRRYVSRGQVLHTDYDAIFLTAQFPVALNLQLTRELLSVLKPGRELYVLLEGNYTIKPFDELLIPYTVSEAPGGEKVLLFTRWDGPIDAKEKAEHYTLDVADRTLYLSAGPGVFSPERLDAGTQALLETVEWKQGSVLDLGCGNGVIGLYASLQGTFQVTMMDSDLRALRWAEENALRNGVKASTIASNGLSNLPQGLSFDLILSNPPYHSDYSVAKAFIEEGFRALSLGGSIWLVVKNPEWYRNKLKSIFGGAKVVARGDYFVVTAEKREVVRTAVKEQKTTRKHEKRVAQSKKRSRTRT